MKSEEEEQLAERLHVWYLQATKELNPDSYNPNAQKPFNKLTEDQKFIDRFIAKKVLKYGISKAEIIDELLKNGQIRAVSIIKKKFIKEK